MKVVIACAFLTLAVITVPALATPQQTTPPAAQPLLPPPAAADAGAKTNPSTETLKVQTSAAVDVKTYVIGAEDQIGIIVVEAPGFGFPSQTVRPDGRITVPLMGDVQAAGKTPKQLEDDISKALSESYLKIVPHVNVIIIAVNSKYYLINGEVLKPGRNALIMPTTILEALVNAGGFKDFADQKHIVLMRGGKPFLTFNYKDAIAGKHQEKNILLEPGDLIIVK